MTTPHPHRAHRDAELAAAVEAEAAARAYLGELHPPAAAAAGAADPQPLSEACWACGSRGDAAGDCPECGRCWPETAGGVVPQ